MLGGLLPWGEIVSGEENAAMNRQKVLTVFLSTSAIVLLTDSAMAKEPFIVSDHIFGHVRMGPPPIIKAPDAVMAPAEHQFKQVSVPNTPGAADLVARAKKTARFALGYDGNAGALTGVAQAVQKTDKYFLLGSVRRDKANDYRAAGGEKINFGYKRTTGQGVFGWTPNEKVNMQVIAINDIIRDDLQPHYSMDPRRTDRKVGMVKFDYKKIGFIDKIETYLQTIDLQRRADNHTNRTLSGPNRLNMKVEARFYNAGLNAKFKTGQFDNTVGVKYRFDDLNARRYLNSTQNAYRFPGIEKEGLSIWGDTETTFAESTHLKVGVRYDRIDDEATRANDSVGGFTPLSLYQTYYSGITEAKVTDDNISAKLRLDHDLMNKNLTLFGQAERLMRAPNPIERWHALRSGVTSSQWIGNPNLDSEAHHKVTLGFDWKSDNYKAYQRSKGGDSSWKIKVSGYYDKTRNFITLDRARGQSGVLRSDSTIIARNVDATLAGFDAEAQYNINRNLSTKVVASYMYGNNDEDDRPLYQIRPFEANWLVDYTDDLDVIGTWNIGAKARFSGKQTRVDDDTSNGLGMDQGTSAAFTTFDLYGSIQAYNRVGISAGIDNILDKHYSEHILGTHVASVSKSRVLAPGRVYYIRATANF